MVREMPPWLRGCATTHAEYDTGMTALASEEREIRDRAVVAWRFAELLRAGFDERVALELAMRPHVDLHLAVRLVDQGCRHETALRILR
jgi:hypothetical protein